MYHDKKITEQDVAKTLGVSEFYIDLMYTGIFLKELNENKNN
jgi:hypothetical protein